MNRLIMFFKEGYRDLRRDSARIHRDLIQSAIVSLALLLLLTVCNRVLFPFYRHLLAEDLKLEVIATGEYSSDSLYHNARLSKILCNGCPVNLSQIPLDGQWQYAEDGDFLYNYTANEPNCLVIPLEDVISLDLVFVTERGSGFVQILVDGETFKTVDLYSDATWEYRNVRYDTSAFVHPEQHPMLLVLGYVFLFLLIFLPVRLRVRAKALDRLTNVGGSVLLQGLLALILMLSCHFIQYQNPEAMTSYLSADYLVHMEAYILVFLPMLTLYFLSRSHALSFAITAGIYEIFHLVSGIKEAARGTPLLPWDFQIAGAALSVADGYDLSISIVTIVTLLCAAVIVTGLVHCRTYFQKMEWRCALFSGTVSGGLLWVFLLTTVHCGIWGTTSDSRVYQVSNYYADNSFLVAFSEYTSYLKPRQAPEGYSSETMSALSEQILQSTAGDSHHTDIRPNIIAIMSESFWDITSLENVTYAEDPLPVYRELTASTMHGDLLSHVFGGNTVISEFEFLTGFHAAFFPSDYMVYGSCLGSEFTSAASILRDQGYHTVAMHPYKATNYNRNTSYKTLGFEEMIFEEDFPTDAHRIRGYVSDSAMYQEVIGLYEQHQDATDEPLFLFGITMQNHGGYWPETLHTPTQVNFTAQGYQESTQACMHDYFAGIRASDEALGELIRYFSASEEPTIVIYFGDHMSDAGTKTEKMFGVQSWYDPVGFSTDLRSHRVPYLVWSNCGISEGETPIMDISVLLPSVLSQTGLDLPAAWRYLLEQKPLVTAFNSSFYVAADNTIHPISEADSDIQTYLDTYELLTYDYVWGHRYADELWDPS